MVINISTVEFKVMDRLLFMKPIPAGLSATFKNLFNRRLDEEVVRLESEGFDIDWNN